jgi:CRP/FNR family cyclic AMP-dependent transcriptional regulator
MDIAEQLAGSPLFKGVDRADREALIKVMRPQWYPKGAVLFHKGDAGDSMYIILSGEVRIFTHDAQDNEITIRHLSEMFGEFSMLDQKPRSASASASADLEVLVLHRDDFNAFLRERQLVGLSMMRNLVERVRYTTTYLQRVLDATEQLSRGNYEAIQAVPDSSADAEIQGLIGAFLQMVRAVRAREVALKRETRS